MFSLHNEGKGLEKQLSIPNTIKSLKETDQQEWMNFIVEASGIHDAISMAQVTLFSTIYFNSKLTQEFRSYKFVGSKNDYHQIRLAESGTSLEIDSSYPHFSSDMIVSLNSFITSIR